MNKVSLNSLVLDFKRTNEGKGVAANSALTGLVAFCVAYASPLPNNGVLGSTAASNAVMRPVLKEVVSTVNELYCVNLGVIEDLCVALYCNRYDAAHGGRRALESFSVREILAEAVGADNWESITLWIERFMNVIENYIREIKEGE